MQKTNTSPTGAPSALEEPVKLTLTDHQLGNLSNAMDWILTSDEGEEMPEEIRAALASLPGSMADFSLDWNMALLKLLHLHEIHPTEMEWYTRENVLKFPPLGQEVFGLRWDDHGHLVSDFKHEQLGMEVTVVWLTPVEKPIPTPRRR